MRFDRTLAALLLLPVLWVGCGSGKKNESLTVTPASASLTVGAKQQLTATGTVSGKGSADVTSLVSWSSNNMAVATVSSSGLATAIATGSAKITATFQGASASATVTVSTTGFADAGAPGDMAVTPVPLLTNLSPPRGVVGGGTSVVITGVHLTGATAVAFGGTAAASFTVDSDTQITAVSPAGTGAVNVTVTTQGGTSNALAFGYGNAPMITGITPSTGPGGATVVLTGSAFTGVNSIAFGTVAATSYSIDSDSQITVIAPAQANGTVQVVVTSIIGASNGVDFTYGLGPSLTSIAPTTGSDLGGMVVTLTGTNLTGATKVSFGTASVTTITAVNDTQITVTTPAHADGAVSVTVTTPFGVSNGVTYTFGPPPTLTSATPPNGSTAGGTPVVLTGTNLTGATSVLFGTTSQAFTVNSAGTQITTTAPASATSLNITVVTPYGTSNALAFGYGNTPTITSLSTTTGLTDGTTSVTINGTNFANATAVSFGSVAATFTSNLAGTQITTTAPAQAAGAVTVTVSNAYGASNGVTFTYGVAPTLTAISPATGSTAGGTTVTLTGANLTGTTGVSFGTTAATTFSVSTDGKTITVTSPAVTAAGLVAVTATTPFGSSNGEVFTYGITPVLTSLAPSAGSPAGGTPVTLTGTNLDTATAVTFGGIAATFVVVDANTITAFAPASAGGTTGSVNVVVTSPYGSSNAEPFTYGNGSVPTVTSVSPTAGPIAGGSMVTINGTGFTATSTVTFASASITPTFVSDTQLTVVSPAHTAGDVLVTVTSAYGTSNPATYTYVDVPTITSVDPPAATTAGNDLIAITGTNLATTSSVTFGGKAGSINGITDTTVLVTTPPGDMAGAVTVTLTTAGGVATATFTYQDPPTITGVTPSSGSTLGGDTVTVTGTNLQNASQVTFGGNAGSSVTVSKDGTSLTVITPTGTAGAVDVTVTTPGGNTTAPGSFTYFAPTAVTGLSPTYVLAGTSTTVTITGNGFSTATQVFFGATVATSFTIDSDTQITAVSPASAAGTVDVTVQTGTGTTSTGTADQFSYFIATEASSVSSFPSGTTITGTNLAWLGTTPSLYMAYDAYMTTPTPGDSLSNYNSAGTPTSVSSNSTHVGLSFVGAGFNIFLCEASATTYAADTCTTSVMVMIN